jgi:Ca-activated chloride channel family protein
MTHRIPLALSLLLGAALPAPAQQSPTARLPRFGTSTEMVRLDVAVTDGGRHAVSNLQAGNFLVYEDGIAQELAFFGQSGGAPLRLTLLVDASGSMQGKIGVVRDAARELLSVLRPGDAARIVQFSAGSRILQDFCGDPATLDQAVAHIRIEGNTRLYDAAYAILKEMDHPVGGDAPLTRHVLVLLTDGEDNASLSTDDQVLEVAQRVPMVVYTVRVDTGPAVRPGDDAAHSQGLHFLTALGQSTGGEAFFLEHMDQLTPLYGRIAGELRTQYSLGYVPKRVGPDKSLHRVVVQIRGDDRELLVRHRPSYSSKRSASLSIIGSP